MGRESWSSAPLLLYPWEKITLRSFEDSQKILEQCLGSRTRMRAKSSSRIIEGNSRKFSNFEVRMRVQFSRVLATLLEGSYPQPTCAPYTTPIPTSVRFNYSRIWTVCDIIFKNNNFSYDTWTNWFYKRMLSNFQNMLKTKKKIRKARLCVMLFT